MKNFKYLLIYISALSLIGCSFSGSNKDRHKNITWQDNPSGKELIEKEKSRGLENAVSLDIKGKKIPFNQEIEKGKPTNITVEGPIDVKTAFFIGDQKKTTEYNVTTSEYNNRGNIYIMGGEGGSTLNIIGNYHGGNSDSKHYSPGIINLGLYASKDKFYISTDKVSINGDATGETEIRFHGNPKYNKTFVEHIHYKSSEDYVIKVKGKAKADTFYGTTASGLKSFEIKYHGKDKNSEHIWKLQKK